MMAEMLFFSVKLQRCTEISAYYCHLVDTQGITPEHVPQNRKSLFSFTPSNTETWFYGNHKLQYRKAL